VHASNADWVCRRQDDERNLGSAAAPVPQLSRHAAGPIPFPFCDSFKGDSPPGFLDQPPPYVCGRDVIEVTHGLAAAANRGWLSLREWEASYRATQLEAEIA